MCSKRSTCCTVRWLGLRTAPTFGTIKRWHGATGWMSLNAMTVSSSYTMSAGSSFRTIRAKMFCSALHSIALPLGDEAIEFNATTNKRNDDRGKGTIGITGGEMKACRPQQQRWSAWGVPKHSSATIRSCLCTTYTWLFTEIMCDSSGDSAPKLFGCVAAGGGSSQRRYTMLECCPILIFTQSTERPVQFLSCKRWPLTPPPPVHGACQYMGPISE